MDFSDFIPILLTIASFLCGYYVHALISFGPFGVCCKADEKYDRECDHPRCGLKCQYRNTSTHSA